MSRPRTWIPTAGLAAALTACMARTPAPPPPPPPSIQVPPGCERPQAGEYQHADNPAFRYQGEDDGGTLTLSVTRAQEDTPVASDAGTTVSIVLERTAEGFIGDTRATAFSAAGSACAVSFPTRAVACDEQGLTLRSVGSLALDADCRPATSGPPPAWKEQRLLRREPAALAPDAGTAPKG